VSNRKASRVVAEAIRELAAEQDANRVLLLEIKDVLVTLVDGLSEHRAHTLTSVNDLGARVKMLESRLGR
jgi:hypothetical protein